MRDAADLVRRAGASGMTAFVSHGAPLAAYSAGRLEEAAQLAQQVLVGDPYAAEAHFCLGLLALQRQDASAIAAFKACLAVRPGEWLLERLRAEFGRRAQSLPRDLALRLGHLLRTSLSPLGPVLAPEARRASHAFVNVVGTSFARSFGGNTAFFPLFIGMGPTMRMLTEDDAAITRRKFAENLRRVDPRRPTLLILGGDPWAHALAQGKAQPTSLGELSDEDAALMDIVARRHGPLLAEASQQIQGRLFLLAVTPTFTAFIDALSRRLNSALETVCAEHGAEFLDCWDMLADPLTGRLRTDYSANAYPGDIHYSLGTTPIFLDALRARGALDPSVSSRADFDWSHVFECEVDKAERTRIWCEPSVSPNNAFRSDKIAASHLAQRLADLVSFLAASTGDRSVVAVNVRDGYPVVAIPPQLVAGVLAFTDTRQNCEAAQMALDFYGRSDVAIEVFDGSALQRLHGVKTWALLLLVHPDSAADDEVRCNAALAAFGPGATVIVGTARPDRLERLALAPRQRRTGYNTSNRHIPEKWRDYSIFVFS